ncbi:MAG: hypothetical protein ABJB01_12505 [Rudaea sp.]
MAAPSMSTPEGGFSLAANSGGGVDSIATPMSSDLGGGTSHERLRPDADVSTETPVSEPVAPENTDKPGTRVEHPRKATGSAQAGAAASVGHKSRANAHWQSLLPGLMN